MSTQYPILYDRPINKWKVAELKEELKRRNLVIKGLKDDLVRRLDEAIRSERAIIEAQRQKDLELNSEPLGDLKEPIAQSHSVQITGDAGMKDVNEVKLDYSVSEFNISGGTSEVDLGKATGGSVSVPSFVESGVLDNLVDTRTKTDDLALTPFASVGGPDGVSGNSGVAKENEILRSAQMDDMKNAEILEATGKSSAILSEVLGTTHIVPNSASVKNDSPEAGIEDIEVVSIAASEKRSDNYGLKLENECLQPSLMDAESHISHSTNQVYEVSENLGFQVQCESITTDNLSNYETNEIKENLNANNIQLEPEVVRPEMVQPSSCKDPSGDGSFDPLDDQVPDAKQGFVVEADDDKSNMKYGEKTDNADDVSAIDHIVENKTRDEVADDITQVTSRENINLDDTVRPYLPPENMESSFEDKFDIAAPAEQKELQDDRSLDAKFSEMTDMADEEPLEKINLDQSSADDSMEDDMLETRHTGSDFDPNKGGAKTKSNEEAVVKPAAVIEALQADIPLNSSESAHENNDRIDAPSEKRKFEVEAAPDNKEPRKRQRRWNEESAKVPQDQSADVSLSTMSKAVLQTAATIPIIYGSNSAIGRDTTIERVVPPSSKTPTNSLRVDHFVRPFTLKAVQELLSKTGKVCNFWMDHIKTHCYVTFTSIEEATETRNALYNLQWPPNGGRLLIAEFVDPEEVKLRMEAPSQSAPPANSSSVLPSQPPAEQLAAAHQHDLRQQIEPQLSHQQATSGPPLKRERLPRARSPVAARNDPPIVTLDDLFRKTKATPRIYYLPLTDERVAAKLNRRRQ
ncbi:hypothetical protein ACH5RR_034527 [Cinchona calisaya]|uniref:SAP domain-containing protein n=1 Tax=Cinchona calisaya TaxID=153742 RepID=A0ABD2YDB8_9GENT